MPFDHITTHPTWCSPLHCSSGVPEITEHRSAPTTWEVVTDDVVVSVGLSRVDDAEYLAPGETRVVLSLEHLGLARTVEVGMTSADARMLSAAIDVAVEGLGVRLCSAAAEAVEAQQRWELDR